MISILDLRALLQDITRPRVTRGDNLMAGWEFPHSLGPSTSYSFFRKLGWLLGKNREIEGSICIDTVAW